jgi:alanine dehydrogenase
MPLILKESEVRELLSMEDGVKLVEEAHRLHAEGGAILAPRLALSLGGEVGTYRIMAAALPGMSTFGLKTLTGVPGRRRPELTYFTILVFDGETGGFLGLLPAGHITRTRTGAAGGVAVKHMARPDSKVLGVFGAGVQARAQVAAIRVVRPIERVKIFDVVPEAAERFAADLRDDGVEAAVVGSGREAVAGSDIVTSATTSKEPVIEGEWLEPGMHVNGVGANSPAKKELAPSVFARGRVVVDYKEQVLLEAGDLIDALAAADGISEEQIAAELGEVVAGTKPGRTSADEITVFKSVGVAFQDIATAAYVYREAIARGMGLEVDLKG